jgi:multiple sugar transport system permease protein
MGTTSPTYVSHFRGNRSYYEAAKIDVAGAWAKFRYITLPGIRNMIVVMVTIHVLWTFNNFDFVWLATGGGPVNATDVLLTYVYRQSWQNHATILSVTVLSIVPTIILFSFAQARLVEGLTAGAIKEA